MTDRQPTAPGQYIMTVDASVAQNLLTGQAVTVTLVRDDHPVLEGTPYNKASVLPDDLAKMICPNVVDPTPADAYKGLLGVSSQIILPVEGWSDNMQQVSVAGVTENNNVVVSPEPEAVNYDAYTSSGIRCVSQGVSTLVFACESVPDVPVTVNVMVRP